MKISGVKDAVIIILVLLVGYKTYQLGNVKPEIVTKIEYKTIEKEVIRPIIYKQFIAGKDTIIFLTKTDTLNTTDTFLVDEGQTLYQDTIKLDSSGFIEGYHVVKGSLIKSAYTPHLLAKVVTVKETKIIEPIRIYGNFNVGKDRFGLGVTLATSRIEAGYNYDLINKSSLFRVGYNFFNINSKK